MKTKELDMNAIEDGNGFFEGSEKLLELWFKADSISCDLRDISRKDIVNILNKVNCQIISGLSNEEIDSYVLSESSLFIAKRRIVLKTCGTTFLLNALMPLVQQAYNLGFCDYQLFYSRRKFLMPQSQPRLHQSFLNEIEFFNNNLNKCGSAYTFGSLNDEHWNLYATDNTEIVSKGDQTFEVVMTDLDPDLMSVFYKENSIDGADVTLKTGIDQLFPEAEIDSYLFDPCGYSMNGLIKEDKYLTMHVTPEPGFSYASFETNYPESNYCQIIKKLLAIFGPAKFFFTLISDEDSASYKFHHDHPRNLLLGNLADCFQRKDWHNGLVNNMDVTYGYFVRNPG